MRLAGTNRSFFKLVESQNLEVPGLYQRLLFKGTVLNSQDDLTLGDVWKTSKRMSEKSNRLPNTCLTETENKGLNPLPYAIAMLRRSRTTLFRHPLMDCANYLEPDGR